MEKTLGLLAGLMALGTLVVFGVVVLRSSKSQNVATWLMWSILDMIMTASMFAAGNNEVWLPAGFTLGAIFLTVVLISKGKWLWGFAETICALGALAAMTIWYFSSPEGAVICSCTAIWVASIPILRDTWNTPDRGTWWFWGLGVISAAVALIVAESWNIKDRFFPLSSVAFNALMTYLVARGYWIKLNRNSLRLLTKKKYRRSNRRADGNKP